MSTVSDDKKKVGAAVVGRAFNVSPETVKRLAAREDNPLPGYKIGGRYRFDLDEVTEWARNQTRGAQPCRQPAPAMSARRKREIEAADIECARRLGDSV